jgi:hypothetical protein
LRGFFAERRVVSFLLVVALVVFRVRLGALVFFARFFLVAISGVYHCRLLAGTPFDIRIQRF